MFGFMRELFILIAHLLVTLAKLGTWGGLARWRQNHWRSNTSCSS
jgi:hypothetical protein